jgi:hypothetical protein
MADVLCVYREVELLKQSAAAGEGQTPAVAIVSFDEKPGLQGSERQHRTCRPPPGAISAWRAITNMSGTER